MQTRSLPVCLYIQLILGWGRGGILFMQPSLFSNSGGESHFRAWLLPRGIGKASVKIGYCELGIVGEFSWKPECIMSERRILSEKSLNSGKSDRNPWCGDMHYIRNVFVFIFAMLVPRHLVSIVSSYADLMRIRCRMAARCVQSIPGARCHQCRQI